MHYISLRHYFIRGCMPLSTLSAACTTVDPIFWYMWFTYSIGAYIKRKWIWCIDLNIKVWLRYPYFNFSLFFFIIILVTLIYFFHAPYKTFLQLKNMSILFIYFLFFLSLFKLRKHFLCNQKKKIHMGIRSVFVAVVCGELKEEDMRNGGYTLILQLSFHRMWP